MATIAQLKEDMQFYKSLGSLIELLKMIAITQYQQLEKKTLTNETYLHALEQFYPWLDLQNVTHPFMKETDKPPCYVVVTSDTGLLGGYNAVIINEAMEKMAQKDGKLVILGKRGSLYVDKSKTVFAVFPSVTDEDRFEQAMKLRDYIVENVLKGNFGTVKIIHARALSVTIQRVETFQLLPFVPIIGDYSSSLSELSDVIFESTPGDLVEYLLHLWLGQKIFEIFGMTQLAEQAARFMHLEVCIQRIKDLDKKLNLQYHRARHEIVDQNMRELFSSRILHDQEA